MGFPGGYSEAHGKVKVVCCPMGWVPGAKGCWFLLVLACTHSLALFIMFLNRTVCNFTDFVIMKEFLNASICLSSSVV